MEADGGGGGAVDGPKIQESGQSRSDSIRGYDTDFSMLDAKEQLDC